MDASDIVNEDIYGLPIFLFSKDVFRVVSLNFSTGISLAQKVARDLLHKLIFIYEIGYVT